MNVRKLVRSTLAYFPAGTKIFNDSILSSKHPALHFYLKSKYLDENSIIWAKFAIICKKISAKDLVSRATKSASTIFTCETDNQ